ncbi:MAG: class I SAM-dependent methyltransferase [Pseudomonadota bacterium]
MSLIPPAELIKSVGVGIHTPEDVIGEYKRVGGFIFNSLQNLAGLTPTSDVLDVGCGTGRVAVPLTSFLTSGSYNGFDIVKDSIDWCNDAFAEYDNFNFTHVDIHSKYYNESASQLAEEFTFPFDDAQFDLIWSSSLFTHMLIHGVDNYLSEMARVLRKGGMIWNSYLLLDERSEPLVLGPRNDGRRMRFPVDGGRIGWKESPEWVTGLYHERVIELHEKHGFEIVDTKMSNWSGGRPLIKFKGQDIIVARKTG